MPYARNALDETRVYFEDDGGDGETVVFHGGFLDSVALVQDSRIAQALRGQFRIVCVDHRGLGQSSKPYDPAAYAMRRRVADAVAVLDELGIERAHFIGLSWGGRLGFGIGEHAPERVRSLVISGQQPYEWPDSPLTRVVTDGLAASRTEGIEALIQGMETFWNIRFPEPQRTLYLENDPRALHAAWTTALSEGPISQDLRSWRLPCLILMGAGDDDFMEQARRAALEIPGAEFVSLEGLDHIGAHLNQGDPVIEAVLRTLRSASAG